VNRGGADGALIYGTAQRALVYTYDRRTETVVEAAFIDGVVVP
jgi:hypothetical protein